MTSMSESITLAKHPGSETNPSVKLLNLKGGGIAKKVTWMSWTLPDGIQNDRRSGMENEYSSVKTYDVLVTRNEQSMLGG